MFKSKVLWIALGAALVLSLAVGGVVAAQGRSVDQNGDGQRGMLALGGQMMRRGMMSIGGGARGGLAFGAMAEWRETTLVSVAAQQLNLTVEQIVADLGQDKTLEQVILAHNGNPQAVVDAYVAARKVTLDKLVADGRLTQAQAEQMLATMREQATEHLKTVGACNGQCAGSCAGAANGETQPHGGMMGGGMGRGTNPGGRGRVARSTQS